jgi:hypothetical protein
MVDPDDRVIIRHGACSFWFWTASLQGERAAVIGMRGRRLRVPKDPGKHRLGFDELEESRDPNPK